MAYKVIILYQLYMPSYFLGTFTEYPSVSFRYICLFFEHFRYYSFEYNLDNYTGTLR